MERAPKVGQRVSYSGGLVVGPCVGVVERIYLKHTWDDDRSDEWNERHAPLSPEPEWHLRMKPDAIPQKWCYSGSDAFAPAIADVEPA